MTDIPDGLEGIPAGSESDGFTLNRPEKCNALNNRLRQDLFDALGAADAGVTGEGLRVP